MVLSLEDLQGVHIELLPDLLLVLAQVDGHELDQLEELLNATIFVGQLWFGIGSENMWNTVLSVVLL